jgi:hypothetical protein
MRPTVLRRILPAVALLVLAVPAPAADFGVRGGYYTDIGEPFLGVEYIAPVTSDIFFNPNVEYVFVDGARYFTLNGDFHYDFHTTGSTFAWVGAGLGVISFEADGFDGETDLGLNVIGGLGTRAGGVIPYMQAKVIVSDGTEFSLGFGVRF